jgi:Protein of unknown function (DUF5818)
MRTLSSPRRPLLLLTALLLAGCASTDGGANLPEPAVTSTVPTPTASPVTPSPKAPATQPDSDKRPAIRVIATCRVEAGGGPGCLLLATDRGRTWLLVGGDRTVLAAGARVRVAGERVASRTAGCQQGEPLRVREATPAG